MDLAIAAGTAERPHGDENAGGHRPRRGIVLGGGGVLGAAWMTGALCAIEQEAGWDPRTAELIVGTSAGSILAALLGIGATPGELREHQLTGVISRGPLAEIVFDYAGTGSTGSPQRPRLGIGSRRLAAQTLRHPRRYPLITTVSAFLPVGRGSLGLVGRLVGDLIPTGGWSAHPGVRTVAMDYDTGERVIFDGHEPEVGLADAVVASCSLPAWFPPALLAGRRYVDGGMWSNTNADLLAVGNLVTEPLDEVWVLAPMAAREVDRPPSLAGRLERRFRRAVNRRLLSEVRAVRAGGTVVRVFSPGTVELHAMGANMMDPRRRLPVLAAAERIVGAQLRQTEGRPRAGLMSGAA